MPKSSKKVGTRKGRQLLQQASQTDFTLAEFADATPTVIPTTRMKKTLTKRWDNSVKELCVKSGEVMKENLPWYEKDLSDFEIDNEDQELSEEHDEEACARTPRKKKKGIEEKFSGGVEYPYDVWCLIGDYVAPESILTFASICRSSHTVVHTARFWSKLYQRYYVEECGLLEDLKPRYMDKAHGLKARVIRALFYTYTPMVARVHARAFKDDPDILIGSKCVIMWYQKLKKHWQFYFKFRPAREGPTCPLSKHSSNTHKYLKKFEPKIDHNPEQDFSILQVTAVHFVPLPSSMGLQLAKTSLGVGHGMRYHKLKLVFTPVVMLNGTGNNHAVYASSINMVIDEVVNVRILNWWDPKYPYTSYSASTKN